MMWEQDQSLTENYVKTVKKAVEGEKQKSLPFISNNSLSLVYCPHYTEAASSPSQNKAPKYHCQRVAHVFKKLCVCVCACMCVCVCDSVYCCGEWGVQHE